jgi:hypothetical protein
MVMSKLAEDDPPRECYLRSVLNLVLPERQETNRKGRIGKVVKEVSDSVGQLISDEKKKEFRSSLENVCLAASEGWVLLQKLKERVEPIIESVYDEDDWKELRLPSPGGVTQKQQENGCVSSPDASKEGSAESPANRKPKLEANDIIGIVWPSFLSYEDDGEPCLLTEGFVLTDQQVKTAREEEMNGPGTRRGARINSRRTRTNSIAVNGGDGESKKAFLSSGSGKGQSDS